MNIFEHLTSRVDAGGRGNGQCYDQFFCPTMPAASTQAMPGSVYKATILAQRVENGEELWHPADRVCFDHGGPYFETIVSKFEHGGPS